MVGPELNRARGEERGELRRSGAKKSEVVALSGLRRGRGDMEKRGANGQRSRERRRLGNGRLKRWSSESGHWCEKIAWSLNWRTRWLRRVASRGRRRGNGGNRSDRVWSFFWSELVPHI
jgi:hypothetical protein